MYTELLEVPLRQRRTMIVVQLRRQIFRQIIPIEEVRATPLPTKVVKYAGKDASKCACPPRGVALKRDENQAVLKSHDFSALP